jgi:hypothetical protein
LHFIGLLYRATPGIVTTIPKERIMQTSSPSNEKKIPPPPPRMPEETGYAAQGSTPGAGASKTMKDYCKTCGRNATWEEIRSWSNPYGISDLHPTDIRVGWKCRLCDTRKGL